MFARDKGQQIEQQVSRYLQKQGLRLIEQNYQCRGGEIDLIMKEKNTLVFVEVRFRKNARFGSALESIFCNSPFLISFNFLHILFLIFSYICRYSL